MLSKSAARAFFLTGTLVCSAALVGLTIDTFRQIPALTHEDKLTPAVARGKDLWDSNNCMGCHTLLGEGAYYAPELTRVYERRGPAFIGAMLRDPEKMYPGQRKMKNYHLKESEIDDLVAFFAWIGEVDLGGFPPKPSLVGVVTPSVGSAGAAEIASVGRRPQVFNQLCIACHALGGQGGAVGPALDLVGDRRDAAYIGRWLTDPTAVKADSKMPKLPLTADQIQELVAFLSQQKSEAKP
jgi:nitric oxide reductase subunit C